jgi:hypothetical protein
VKGYRSIGLQIHRRASVWKGRGGGEGGTQVWLRQDFVKGRGNGCRSDPGGGGDDTQGYRGGNEDSSRVYLIYFRWKPLFLSSGASVEAFDFWRCLVLTNQISWRLPLLRFFFYLHVEQFVIFYFYFCGLGRSGEVLIIMGLYNTKLFLPTR